MKADQKGLKDELDRRLLDFPNRFLHWFQRIRDHMPTAHDKVVAETDVPDGQIGCAMHHEAAMQCLRELVRSGLVLRARLASDDDLNDLVWRIFYLHDSLPPNAGERTHAGDQGVSCSTAESVRRNLQAEIANLIDLVRNTKVGLCLECFRNKPPNEKCDHPWPKFSGHPERSNWSEYDGSGVDQFHQEAPHLRTPQSSCSESSSLRSSISSSSTE